MSHAPQPASPVNFEVPSGAWDRHTHIHAPQFPFYAGRGYTPGAATPGEMTALHKRPGIRRVVIVHPSGRRTQSPAQEYVTGYRVGARPCPQFFSRALSKALTTCEVLTYPAIQLKITP